MNYFIASLVEYIQAVFKVSDRSGNIILSRIRLNSVLLWPWPQIQQIRLIEHHISNTLRHIHLYGFLSREFFFFFSTFQQSPTAISRFVFDSDFFLLFELFGLQLEVERGRLFQVLVNLPSVTRDLFRVCWHIIGLVIGGASDPSILLMVLFRTVSHMIDTLWVFRLLGCSNYTASCPILVMILVLSKSKLWDVVLTYCTNDDFGSSFLTAFLDSSFLTYIPLLIWPM